MFVEDQGIDVEDGWQELNLEGLVDVCIDFVFDYVEEYFDLGKNVYDDVDVEGEL